DASGRPDCRPSADLPAPRTRERPPAISNPAGAATAAPATAAVTMRPANWAGTVRLAVEGSWSTTVSTSTIAVNIATAQTEPRKASVAEGQPAEIGGPTDRCRRRKGAQARDDTDQESEQQDDHICPSDLGPAVPRAGGLLPDLASRRGRSSTLGLFEQGAKTAPCGPFRQPGK